MSTIEKLLKGSIDMHMHAGPDPRVERSVDALQAALQAQEAGMRAIVLKSHEYPTAPVAYVVNLVVQGIAVIGSITLNPEVGGLNARAVEGSARLGARVVWIPTTGSTGDMAKKNKAGIALLDADGRLLPAVTDVMEVIRKHRMVLATGHTSKPEIFALVAECNRMNIEKMVITHPLTSEVGGNLTLEEQGLMAQKGAFIEHPFNLTSPMRGRINPHKLLEAIRSTGAARCILSTDFGQLFNPVPAEGMRIMIATLLQCGCTENEIELMVKTNPAKLLDLE